MNNLKAARKNTGLTQAQVAEKFGVTIRTVTSWETGEKLPRTNRLNELAALYGVTSDYLLGLNSAPAETKSPVYDDEALELMEQMHKRPELKVLFSTSKKASKEDIEAVDRLLRHMAGMDEGDDGEDG